MSAPELAPRNPIVGVAAVWALGVVAAVVIGVFAPTDRIAVWLAAGLGACLLVAFVVQLGYGRARGFVERVAASAVGALIAMGVVSLLTILFRTLLGAN